MPDSLIEALGRVYAAAYAASGEHKGMEAGTIPEIARANGWAAAKDFLDLVERGRFAKGAAGHE